MLPQPVYDELQQSGTTCNILGSNVTNVGRQGDKRKSVTKVSKLGPLVKIQKLKTNPVTPIRRNEKQSAIIHGI